ncbi:helix-turn-helix domain-containing protein [Microbacterium sp. NPDC019599]|uniref:TetR/AcrR family transcriptional regulator n=1 Tax=Microbacterium sp. NPDC019599 TaxID=3154690 RepID=UPI0033D01EE8
MSDGADSTRDRRRAETTRTLIRVARHFTAERGLSGFTVEELCSEAAVSRRTFFNYFASKDDAVLGIPLERADAAAVARFLATRPDVPGLSPTLLTDLAVLAEERWRALDIAPDTAADLFRAVDKEPRLLGRMLELAIQGEQFDARLVEQRENLLSGDLRAQVAAQVVGALVRSAAGEFLAHGNTDTFIEIFERRIGAARDLFASQAALMGTPE